MADFLESVAVPVIVACVASVIFVLGACVLGGTPLTEIAAAFLPH